jgi:hypothetical protein
MSTAQVSQTEDLNKSIDALLDEVFSDVVEKGSPLDLAADNSKTADEAVNKAPKMQMDDARGAGRPKQISDVPQNDTDGRRASEYDDAIAEASGAKEPDEAKKQAKAIDQVSSEGHLKDGSKAPRMAPFKKSEVQISEEEYQEYEEFKKAKVEATQKKVKEEELRKTEDSRKQNEELIKSAVGAATSKLAKENDELRKSILETQSLIKAMASQPMTSKSITNIQVLEKSARPEEKGNESFSKSDVLDAAFELAKAGKISSEVVSEIEMTNRCSDQGARATIEKYLESR